jgi:hypothetical protein
MCLAGWDWDKRPDWAIEHGLQGVNVDHELLQRFGVETRTAIPFSEVIDFQGRGLFCPVFHRPLFNYLGLVTNRTFETFCANTIPLLMLPRNLVEAVYGPDALPLAPGESVAERIQDMIERPNVYWDSVLNMRKYLSLKHSYEQRFKELASILEC